MRKEESVRLLTEQTGPDGKVTQKWTKFYEIRQSYDAWLKVTRKDLLEKGKSIIGEERVSKKPDEGPEPPQPPKSTPLF
jgi:hypothetical protein